MGADDLSVLAQRAASEDPRWTRAVEDQSAPIPKEITSELGRSMDIVRCAQSRATLATPCQYLLKRMKDVFGEQPHIGMDQSTMKT
ncbi:MAG: hypothetical protein JW384_01380 [Nitrosomonadaceae bacterium]|nr:hypothetical protein [Nitrosomonadaceae bacterium]